MNLKEYFDYTKYAEILHLTKFELAFCLGYFILALMICTYSTPKGSLFSPDSIGYVRMAESIYRNHNLLSSAQPIYPALIALGMGLGLNVEQSAGIVPIMCYSLLGFPLFLLGKITSRPIAAYITCIICLICGKYLLYISANALTDMVYLFISVIAMLFFAIYNKHGSLSSITFAGIFALLAALTRNIGITLILAGIIVIITNSKGLNKSLTSLMSYCLISIIPFFIWQHVTRSVYNITTASSNPPLNEMVSRFWTTAEMIFYNDYKLIVLITILIISVAMIYMYLRHHLIAFIKDTIPFTCYIFVYSIILILVTSSLWISVDGGQLDIRKLVQIYPFLALVVVSLFVCFYNIIEDRFYKISIKTFSIILLICLVAQGVNPLYSQANGIRVQSINDYPDKLELNKYISKYNITDNETIYFDVSNGYNAHFSLVFHERTPHIKMGYVQSTSPKTTVLDNLTLPFAGAGPASARSLADLIKENKNHSIYLIAPLKVAQNYMELPPKDICFINPAKFLKSFICMVDLKNNESCNINPFPRDYIIDNSSSITTSLAGNFTGQKHDQLLILKSNPSSTKETILQIIDFAKVPPLRVEYDDRPGTAWPSSNNSLLSGDFMDLGYDQALHIAGGVIIIEDFSQGKAPAITRYSEVLANNSALKNLADAEDALLAGDFLGQGYSQVLFVDRNPKWGKLVIADFSKGKTPEMTEFSEIEGNSTLLSSLLNDKDKQFSGDFMDLGHSQLLMINCNHTRAKEPKIIIADFRAGKKSASFKYLENWDETSGFDGWLDADDTQLVGDFMGLGHSQVLFVNHGHAGGKIMIDDFSQGKPPANVKYWESWDKGTIFQGWLDINDTRIAGDFKELGYSQMLFLNSSINGSNATIVEFINGKPEIAL